MKISKVLNFRRTVKILSLKYHIKAILNQLKAAVKHNRILPTNSNIINLETLFTATSSPTQIFLTAYPVKQFSTSKTINFKEQYASFHLKFYPSKHSHEQNPQIHPKLPRFTSYSLLNIPRTL